MSLLEREKNLLAQLRAVGPDGAALFAAACAERLRPIVRRVSLDAQVAVAAVALDGLWRVLAGAERPEILKELAQSCRAALPPEDESMGGGPDVYLEDAVAAAYYALEAHRLRDAQQAIWAARRGHEAADHCVLSRLSGPVTIDAKLGEASARDPLVFSELQHQDRDIREIVTVLGAGGALPALATTLRERAVVEGQKFVEALLGDSEYVVMPLDEKE